MAGTRARVGMLSKRGLRFGAAVGLLVVVGTGAMELFIAALVASLGGRGSAGLVEAMAVGAGCYAMAAALVAYAAASRPEPRATLPSS